MMYRSGWATKSNQERVLAIEISREGFEWALEHSCLSSYHADIHSSNDAWRAELAATPVRIQWDPERDIHLDPRPERAIQIGLGQRLASDTSTTGSPTSLMSPRSLTISVRYSALET